MSLAKHLRAEQVILAIKTRTENAEGDFNCVAWVCYAA